MSFHLTPSPPVAGYGEALLPLAAAKAHLSIEADDTQDDALIESLRDAAIETVEQYCGIRLAPCTGIEAHFEAFAPKLRLGIGPAFSVSVTGISYDVQGVTTVLDASAWRIAAGGALVPAAGTCWPYADAVMVTFDAGYPAGECPPALIIAVKMLVAHFYRNREAVAVGVTVAEMPLGVTVICGLYRMPVL